MGECPDEAEGVCEGLSGRRTRNERSRISGDTITELQKEQNIDV